MQFQPRFVLLVSGLLVFTAIGSAQVTTATLYGTVTDPTGAVIPGADVTMTHKATGSSQTKEANALGEVAFDFLRVGTYTLEIEAQGFKKYEDNAFELAAGQAVRTTFVLEDDRALLDFATTKRMWRTKC